MISSWADGISLEEFGDRNVIGAIEDATGGRVRVVRAGGPESVPSFQQLVPMRDGLFEVNSTTCAYHPDFTSLACGWNAIKGSLDSKVACGMWDLIDEFYQKEVGVKYLGGVSPRVGSRTYLTKPIDPTTGRLDGIKLRASGPTATAFVENLGGTASRHAHRRALRSARPRPRGGRDDRWRRSARGTVRLARALQVRRRAVRRVRAADVPDEPGRVEQPGARPPAGRHRRHGARQPQGGE